MYVFIYLFKSSPKDMFLIDFYRESDEGREKTINGREKH